MPSCRGLRKIWQTYCETGAEQSRNRDTAKWQNKIWPNSKAKYGQIAKLFFLCVSDIYCSFATKNLLTLSGKIDTTKMKKPSFLMILTAVGDYAYVRTDGVLVVPIGCLKDWFRKNGYFLSCSGLNMHGVNESFIPWLILWFLISRIQIWDFAYRWIDGVSNHHPSYWQAEPVSRNATVAFLTMQKNGLSKKSVSFLEITA